MAELVSIYCPHCHKHTSLDPAPVKHKHGYDEYTTQAFWKKSNHETWWMGVCNACENPVLVRNRATLFIPHRCQNRPSRVFLKLFEKT